MQNIPTVLFCINRTLLKPRPGQRRLFLLLILFNYACYIFAYNGTEVGFVLFCNRFMWKNSLEIQIHMYIVSFP